MSSVVVSCWKTRNNFVDSNASRTDPVTAYCNEFSGTTHALSEAININVNGF
jgi:hypothetical protein